MARQMHKAATKSHDADAATHGSIIGHGQPLPKPENAAGSPIRSDPARRRGQITAERRSLTGWAAAALLLLLGVRPVKGPAITAGSSTGGYARCLHCCLEASHTA
jgi:hypothetical protein